MIHFIRNLFRRKPYYGNKLIAPIRHKYGTIELRLSDVDKGVVYYDTYYRKKGIIVETYSLLVSSEVKDLMSEFSAIKRDFERATIHKNPPKPPKKINIACLEDAYVEDIDRAIHKYVEQDRPKI